MEIVTIAILAVYSLISSIDLQSDEVRGRLLNDMRLGSHKTWGESAAFALSGDPYKFTIDFGADPGVDFGTPLTSGARVIGRVSGISDDKNSVDVSVRNREDVIAMTSGVLVPVVTGVSEQRGVSLKIIELIPSESSARPYPGATSNKVRGFDSLASWWNDR